MYITYYNGGFVLFSHIRYRPIYVYMSYPGLKMINLYFPKSAFFITLIHLSCFYTFFIYFSAK